MNNDSFFDGNAVAGELREVFCNDLTSAIGQCGNCGGVAPLARARVYSFDPGIVMRCVICEHPLLRMTAGGGRRWLDVRGLVYLEFETR